mmetsp:Transcript_17627/g.12659  ORF Transcript_17627/g.12659 Transcript_17627/m.12659 type:complete len:94 (-) Transcript_17627:381-662(-)
MRSSALEERRDARHWGVTRLSASGEQLDAWRRGGDSTLGIGERCYARRWLSDAMPSVEDAMRRPASRVQCSASGGGDSMLGVRGATLCSTLVR